MKTQDRRKVSKRMSYWLRHRPDLAGFDLTDEGWVSIADLLNAFSKRGMAIDEMILREVVETNDKQRFEYDDSGERVRARQGHSVSVELGYKPMEPPEFLFHGTASRNIDSILEKGLHKAGRHHVHLSTDQALMLEVARRHGRPVLVKVHAGKMQREGMLFYLTENSVWLTDSVPPQHLEIVPTKD